VTNIEYIVNKMDLIGSKLYVLEQVISDIRGELEELDYLRSMLEKSQELD
jgi:hypothetical protein